VSIVCIIPARGGSKRIPRKNVKPFCGKPMIAWSIEAAQGSRLFDRIIVSTDDDEIASVAQEYGVDAPFRRPPQLANDFAGTDAVLLHALDWLKDNGGVPSYFCCLYATAPFVSADALQRGLELLKERHAVTAFSVTTFPYSIFRALRLKEDGRVEMFWPENFHKRSQDFPEVYHDAGQFYWADTTKYLEEGRLFSEYSVPVLIPRQLVQDIDTPEDWEVAERMHKVLRE
jgi:pseudaminic acid cytidylyltransferase